MIKQKWFGIFFLAVLGLGFAFWGFELYKKKGLELKNKKMVKNLSAVDYRNLLKEEGVYNLDVREKFEFNSGHIKGATVLPSTDFYKPFNKLNIGKDDKIALYCRSGNRSAVIAEELISKGYKNVYNMEFGINEWKEEGFEIEK